MPITTKTHLILIGALGLTIGFSGRYIVAKSAENARARGPASTSKPVLKPLKIGKHLALVTTEIGATTEIPEKDDQEVQLVASIQAQQNLESDLTYQWVLPEGVHLIEGQLQDGLTNVQAGQLVQVRLTVTGFSKESQKVISLQAYSTKGNMQMGNSAVIVSRAEDTWESIAPQMREEAIKQLEKPKE